MQYILETLGKIGFEWQMGLFNLINFLIIFWILKRFAFKPIMNALNERQQKAAESVENFQKAKTELQMAERKAQDIVDQSKVDANKVMERATEEAKRTAEGMRDKAKNDIELLVAQAKKNIEIDKKEMKDEIQKETASLVVAAVEKVLDEKVDSKKDAAYIDSLVKTLK